MFKIGCHLSSSKGYLEMGKTALKINANTFQFFSRNPRGGAIKALDKEDIGAFKKFAAENNFAPILAHAPYTYNACSANPKLRAFARASMAEDLARFEYLPGTMYNFHPGSHVGQGTETGIKYITETLNAILKPEQSTTVLLETMAGKGSEVGRTFEELKQIIDNTEQNQLLGVCLDTCHIFDGGYDIINGLDGVLERFDNIIGIKRLRAVHLNDSKNEMGSHKDRHEKIGEGHIGIEAITRIINHPSLRELPFYLETPNDTDGYAKEISMLRGLYEG
jgi:deoxyribonuclease-4